MLLYNYFVNRFAKKYWKEQNNFKENKLTTLGWNVFVISYLLVSVFAFIWAIYYFIVSRQTQNVFDDTGTIISSFKLINGIESKDIFYLLIVIADFSYTIFIIYYYLKNKNISYNWFIIMLIGRIISIAYLCYHAWSNLEIKNNYPHSITQQYEWLDLGIITNGQEIKIHYSWQFEVVRNISYAQFAVAGLGALSIVGALVLGHFGKRNSGTYYV